MKIVHFAHPPHHSTCRYLFVFQGYLVGTPLSRVDTNHHLHLFGKPIFSGSFFGNSPLSCWTSIPTSVLSNPESTVRKPQPPVGTRPVIIIRPPSVNNVTVQCWNSKPLSVVTETRPPIHTPSKTTRGTKRTHNLNTMPQTTPTTEEHLHVIKNYRTKHCDYGVCRAGTNCPKYHNKGERRRDPRVHRYKPELCPDDPSYARNMTELMYHPKLFKTRLCNGKCGKSKRYCAFAHGKEDVSKYKDSWPY